LSNEVLQMTKLDAGELHFGSGPALAVRLVPDALRHFIERHPASAPRCWWTIPNAWVRPCAEQIEFSSTISARSNRPQLPHRSLVTPPRPFLLPPCHPLLAKDSLSTNDLFSYPLASAA
jgi:DNA-binding transcriptional LysR family regulator